MTQASILWIVALGIVFYLMMRNGGGCCGGHDHGHGGHGSQGGEGPGDQGRQPAPPEHHHPVSSDDNPEAGTDPVCGMEVPAGGQAPRSEYGGRTFRFCSESCKKEFDLDPGSYLS